MEKSIQDCPGTSTLKPYSMEPNLKIKTLVFTVVGEVRYGALRS
jgi:hypothetical protein